MEPDQELDEPEKSLAAELLVFDGQLALEAWLLALELPEPKEELAPPNWLAGHSPPS